MKMSFELAAEFRNDEGKGASRRLRRAGRVPAIMYGGKRDPRALSLDHQKLVTLAENEKFYSTIIGVKVDGEVQPAIVKDLQMHPAEPRVLHVDLQRVLPDEKIRLRLPIHFKGESVSPGVKTQGGVVSHEGPAGRDRARPLADEDKREQVDLRHPAAGGRRRHRGAAGQGPGRGLHPQPARRGAGDPGGRGGGCDGRGQAGRSQEGRAGQEGRRQEVTALRAEVEGGRPRGGLLF
jgi:ribosomal protein bL25 (Ctc-form)